MFDINVLTDVAVNREPFASESGKAIDRVIEGRITGYVPAHASVSVPGILLIMPELWIVMAILSAVGAIFGPSLYHRHTMRGRGTLKDIKEDGWYDGDKF